MMVSASPIIASLQNAERLWNERDAASTQEATVDAHHSSVDPPTSSTLQPNSGLPAPPPNTAAPSAVRTRAVQRVLTRSYRVRIVKWMSEEVSRAGSKHIASKAVRQFSHLFHGNEKANNSKANCLWKARLEYLEADYTTCPPCSITRVTSCGFKRAYLMAMPGRGRKRSVWYHSQDFRILYSTRRRACITRARLHVCLAGGWTTRVTYRRTPTRVPYRRMDHTCDLQAHAYTCALQADGLHVCLTDGRTTHGHYRPTTYCIHYSLEGI